jgi:hypothetical protein
MDVNLIKEQDLYQFGTLLGLFGIVVYFQE